MNAHHTQPLARLGAQVTGIDIVESNIAIAKEHASVDRSLRHLLSYQCRTLEDLVAGDPSASFDCVVASEVIEHVVNLEDFTSHLCRVVKVSEVALCMGCQLRELVQIPSGKINVIMTITSPPLLNVTEFQAGYLF